MKLSCICLFVLMLSVLVNTLQPFHDTSFAEDRLSCKRTQNRAPGKTNNPSTSSLALYHWINSLLCRTYKILLYINKSQVALDRSTEFSPCDNNLNSLKRGPIADVKYPGLVVSENILYVFTIQVYVKHVTPGWGQFDHKAITITNLVQ